MFLIECQNILSSFLYLSEYISECMKVFREVVGHVQKRITD
jgi:hypothetical protein